MNIRTCSLLRKHPFLLALRRWGRFARFAKRPQRQRARRNEGFRRLSYTLLLNVIEYLTCQFVYYRERIIREIWHTLRNTSWFYFESNQKILKSMEISRPQFPSSSVISETSSRHYFMVSGILNRLNSNVVTFLSISWAKSNFCLRKVRINESSFSCSIVFHNSEAQTTMSGVRKECQHKSSSCWLDKQSQVPDLNR